MVVHGQCDQGGERHDAKATHLHGEDEHAWPKVVQCVVELTMEIPHVEMADTAVKNAVVNVVVSSFGVAMGVIRQRSGHAASVRK